MLVKSSVFPLVAVDIGNSRVKFAFFDGNAANRPVFAENRLDYAGLGAWLAANGVEGGTVCWGISSVNDLRHRALEQWIGTNRPQDRPFVHQIGHRDIPLEITLEQPEAVGIDRLLVAFAAAGLFGKNHPHLLLVDAGTAVTVDLLVGNSFHGGAILPGLATAASALHELTERLPCLDTFSDVPPTYPGRDTLVAMEFGIRASVIGAIRMCAEAAMQKWKWERLPIVLAGGSATLLRGEMRDCGFDLLDVPDTPGLLALGIVRCMELQYTVPVT